jgi:hypothetical protein
MFFIIKKRHNTFNIYDDYYDEYNNCTNDYKPKYKIRNKIYINYLKFKNFVKSKILKK